MQVEPTFQLSYLTPYEITNMLRGEGRLKANQSVKTADVKVLVLQGLLSQVFKVEVTYENGTSDLPSSLIAKFLTPEPAFALTRTRYP